jgi:hypothetical protein
LQFVIYDRPNSAPRKNINNSIYSQVFVFMVPGSRVNSNSENQYLAENNQNKKPSSFEQKSSFSAETCRELFDMLAQWNTYLEDHVPYFQSKVQEPTS